MVLLSAGQATAASPVKRGRGRPRLYEDDVLLDAAYEAFARDGYDAMSVRTLATDLGLSHGAMRRRFGTKDKLFDAAVDRGLVRLGVAMEAEAARRPQLPSDDLAALREIIRRFLAVLAQQPDLAQLAKLSVKPRFPILVVQTAAIKDRLVDAGRIYPCGMRQLYSFVAYSAITPVVRTQRSAQSDPEAQLEETTDFIMRGISK